MLGAMCYYHEILGAGIVFVYRERIEDKIHDLIAKEISISFSFLL